MRHALLAALSRPRRARSCCSGLREAVAHQVLVTGSGRDLRVPPRAGRRGGLRRPAAGRAQRAARAARGDRRRAPRADGRRAGRGRGRHARLPLERGARRAARARRLGRRRAWRPSACSRSARRSATSSARWSCGTACPTPRSARAATAPTCCATPPRRPPTPARSARSLALVRKAIAEVDARGRPAARGVPATSGSATTCAGPARPRTASPPTSARWSCVPDGREPRSAPALLEHRARGLMLRGRFAERRRAARPRRCAMAERCGDAAIAGPRAQHARALARRARRRRRGHRAAAPLARPRRARRGHVAEHVQAMTNLSDVLDLAGRTEEALGRGARPAMEVAARATPSARLRHVHGAAGRQPHDPARPAAASSSPACRRRSSATPSAPRRSSSRELRARLALLDRRPARRRGAELDELRRLCLRHARPAVDGAAARAERAAGAARGPPGGRARRDRRGLAAHRAAPRRARGSCGCVWIGLMVEATARRAGAGARRAGSDGRRGAAARRARPRPRRCRASGPRAGLRGARARRGRPAARRARRARRPTRRLGGARPRRSPRSRSRGRPPTRASAPPRRTCRPATAPPRRRRCAPRASGAAAMGAAPLLGEIDALARRARLAIAEPRPPPSRPRSADESPAAQLGLTPRELEVLLLVAAGPHEPRDRRGAVHEREDRQRARLADPRQARRRRPRRGGGGRAPPGPHGDPLLACEARAAPPPVRFAVVSASLPSGSGQSLRLPNPRS